VEGGSCSCESCLERSALVAEMAEETKKLQQCWLQLRKVRSGLVKHLVTEEAGGSHRAPARACLERFGTVYLIRTISRSLTGYLEVHLLLGLAKLVGGGG
jgi:hypothetical protein